ncbi:MAG: hypothetical protein ACYCOR_14895 [Acidobacteriaceae bacterium]
MRVAIELATIYGIYIGGMSLLIWRYVAKNRGSNIVVAAAMPLLAVLAIFLSILLVALKRTEPRVGPCPYGLMEAEEIVEKKRQNMFGGDPQKPHFARDWAALYAATLEQEAERVHRFADKVLTVA